MKLYDNLDRVIEETNTLAFTDLAAISVCLVTVTTVLAAAEVLTLVASTFWTTFLTHLKTMVTLFGTSVKVRAMGR